MKIYLHHPLCHIPSRKSQKDFFTIQKSFRVLNLLRGFGHTVLFEVLSDGALFRILGDRFLYRILRDNILFRILSDRVFFRVLSDRALLKVLSGRVVFSVSLISSVLFYSIFIRTHLRLTTTFINNLNKTDSEKHKDILMIETLNIISHYFFYL